MVFTVLAGAAELEQGLIFERTKTAMAEAKQRDIHCGRAHTLNAEAVPTAHGGARWYASTVRNVVVAG